jgi:RNA polymerase sigma-70 factor (ECF subfamily)
VTPSPPDGRPLPTTPALRLVVDRTHPDDERHDRLARAVAADRDRAAFAQLFEALGPRLKAWLVRSGSSPEVADDIVQDAFVILWRKADLFDERRAGVGGWLYAIARNLRIDRHRSHSDAWLSLDDDPVSDLADPEPPVEDRITARQRVVHLRDALARLGSEDRQYLHWSFFDEKSHSDIASDLGIPLGTVKTRIRRAASRLRQFLEGNRP